ncbi:MAG: hypothetical protein MZU95_03015 [Desulfomicrobium escambiense]|nr:hypothetical protein [Desulfomicrobium escambiense]
MLGQIHACKHSQGNRDHARDDNQHQGPHKRICNAAAGFSNGPRQTGQKIHVNDRDAVADDIKNNQQQRQNHHCGTQDYHCLKKTVLDYSEKCVPVDHTII